MPELPEVETIKTAIEKSIGESNIIKVLINNKKLRKEIPDDFADKVTGSKICRYIRRGKYIIMQLDNDYSIIIHLGMSGRIKICESMPEAEKHDHAVFITDKGIIIYNDARRFGLITYCPTKKLAEFDLFANIGIEPFDDKLNAEYLHNKLKNKRIPIKEALLDQSIITGIGNIYASEALFEAGILPTRESASITMKECKTIIEKVIAVLQKAIKAGGSTLRDYKKPDGSLGYFQNMHCVYNKAGQRCPNCTCDINKTGGIQKVVLAGRSTFYCATKQK